MQSWKSDLSDNCIYIVNILHNTIVSTDMSMNGPIFSKMLMGELYGVLLVSSKFELSSTSVFDSLRLSEAYVHQ